MAASVPNPGQHPIAVEMLLTDADLAVQSIFWILRQDDRDAVARLVRNTRHLYESIGERRKTLTLSEREAASLEDNMDRLRARLRFLGESV